MHTLENEDWDPLTLHAPNQEILPAVKMLPDDVPFCEGRELIVDIPVNPKGIAEVYINDTCGLTVEDKGSDNVTRLERAILLAIYVAS